ncbi:MAG: glycosyltransferase [bacterium]|nr:glycosyltransferase [bacterium]
MIACVVPAYRARDSVRSVVESLLAVSDLVVVVDDGCPDRSGDVVRRAFVGDPRVAVLQRERNGGVGAAMKTGIEHCLAVGADVIVKVDADGQMDPSFVPHLAACLEHNRSIGFVKGNRFASESVLRRMPPVRLIGNSLLSILVKFASGYWNLLDPTNGFVAFRAETLRDIPWERFADSYFFETSVLGELGLANVPIGEVEMPTIYGTEQSSLSIRRVALEFPPKLLRMFLRRMLLHYFLFDVNLGSIYIFFGLLFALAGITIGGIEWFQTLHTGHVRTAGTVMLAVLPTLIGFQLLSNALMYDVQFAPKTVRERAMRAKDRDSTLLRRLG